MCKFCEKLFNNKEKLILDKRTSYADDNICEYLSEGTVSCDICKGQGTCKQTFEISGTKFHDEDHAICVSYFSEIGDLKIQECSELMYINYCPVCGKRLSKGFMSDNRIIYHMNKK